MGDDMDWDGKDRRIGSVMDEAMIEHIAERAAEHVMRQIYERVGKSILSKAAMLVGMAVVAGMIWIAGAEHLGQK